MARTLIAGAGLMGTGIAQVVARSGFPVTLVDVSEEVLRKSIAQITSRLERSVAPGALSKEECAASLARIETSTDFDAVAPDATHLIEAIPEDLELKLTLFARADTVCAPEVIFATNTSQFSITRLAAATSRPDRVIGMHWFNPAPVLDLIEVVRGEQTSDATVEVALERARAYGKRTILCRRDSAGFVTTRLILALMLEAMRVVEEGIATVDDVNRACVQAFGHRMGPLETADLTGLDTVLHVAESLRQQYGDRFLPTQSLRALVSAGHLGRKSGQGFTAK